MSEIKLGIYNLVDSYLEKKANEKESRDYLGGSIIGKECSRALWYDFYSPKKITHPRVNRIFDLGNLIEDYVISLLKGAGLTVYESDENGEQFGFVDGHIAGHIDGVVTGLPESSKPHLLEIKSANSKRFKEFQDKGYKSNKTYWTQVQVYMFKMGLERALVAVMNKDNCELYFERIELDKKFAERQLLRAKEIVKLKEEPVRPYSKPTFYKCKFCDHREECWNLKEE